MNSLRNNTFWKPEIESKYNFDAEIVISNGDCVEILSEIPAETIKLIITSPPYNIGKSYEKSTSLENYLDSMRPAIEQIVRVLSSEGSICWQIGIMSKRAKFFRFKTAFSD